MKSGFRCLSISILPCVRVDVEVAACESSLSSLESVQDIGRLHSVLEIDYDKVGSVEKGIILNECDKSSCGELNCHHSSSVL